MEAARKSGAEVRKPVPDPLAVGPSAAVQPQEGPRGAGSGFRPQEESEVKYNQYCQQRDCQVSADNIFMGRCIVLLFGFSGEGEPREKIGRAHV